MRFADVAGQDNAVALLRRTIRAGRLPHAYLFDGPAGVGKRGAAVGLGLALVCTDAPGEGCGRCAACKRTLERNHPDVWVFDPTGLTDQAKAAGEKSAVKYAAREVFPWAMRSPHEAAARLLVVDHADEMSPDVQNTLLKTLEEPRPGVHIVLVTAAPDRLLPTIRSRTQRVRFVPVRAAVLVELAVARGHQRGQAETAAALAGGSVARMLELCGAEGEAAPWPDVTELRRAAAARDMGAIFDAAVALGDKQAKERLPATLALLAGLYRDALATAVGAPELALLRERAADIDGLAAAAAGASGLPRLLRALRATLDAEEALVGNINAVAALERLLIEARPCERGVAG